MRSLYKHNIKPSLRTLLMITLLTPALFFSCKKVTDDVQVVISSEVIKYTALVTVIDAKDGKSIPNAKLVVSGQDADMVYNFLGRKDFTVIEGQVGVGLHPRLIPSDSRPAIFYVEVSADGYLPVAQEVIIRPSQKYQTVQVNMINLSAPPAGMEIVQKKLTLVGGKLAKEEYVKSTPGPIKLQNGLYQTAGLVDTIPSTDSVYQDDGVTTVILPKNTTFAYHNYEADKTKPISTRSVPVYGDPITVKSNAGGNSAPGASSLVISGASANGSVSATGVDITYRPITGYYQDTIYANKQYTGTVTVVCVYYPGSNKDMSIFPENYFSSHNIKLTTKEVVPENEMLFQSVVKKALYGVYFMGRVTANGVTRDIYIDPSHRSKWRTSFQLDEKAVNPRTGRVIKPGDIIDLGVDYGADTVLKSRVWVSKNGGLRAETQTTNAGFYYRGQYKQSFNFTISNAVDSSYIPDPENISCYWSGIPGLYGYSEIRFNTNGSTVYQPLYFVLRPNDAYYDNYVNKGTIVSRTPISVPTLYTNIGYFDQRLIKTTANGQKVNPFIGWTNLKDQVTFDVTLNCNLTNQKPLTIKPTYTNYAKSERNGYFYFHAVNGKWSTKGLTPGQTLSYEYKLSKGLITFTKNNLDIGLNEVVITYTGSNNSFCM
jgi:hypothetical protein